MGAEQKHVSEREFLETWGLYRRLSLRRGWAAPDKLSRTCRICKKETTWSQKTYEMPITTLSLYILRYLCVDCEEDSVVFVVSTEVEKKTERAYPGPNVTRAIASDTWKVGQLPQPSVSVAPRLEKHLGDDAELYRKGLTCLNEGFGIGAVSYFRRVVENKTNELIDVVAELAAAEGVPDDQVKRLRSAKDEKAYEKKLKVAAPLVPTSLRPGGVSPLAELYRLLSLGLHGRTEDECVQIADDLRSIFEYVFERLRAQFEDHRSFTEKITKIASKWKPQAK